jgi:hypothetical protein
MYTTNVNKRFKEENLRQKNIKLEYVDRCVHHVVYFNKMTGINEIENRGENAWNS